MNPLDFEIINSLPLFQDQHYSLSYRLVLLHALQNYFRSGGRVPLTSLLETLLEVSRDSKGFYQSKFVEIYPFQKADKKGILLIDKSKGCYPLVLYPEDKNPAHGNRVSTFIQALEDLLENVTFYEDLLVKNSNWDEGIVNQLRGKFTFPEKNTHRKAAS